MIYKTTPYKHQKEICDYIDDNNIDYYALFWDMGAGKTKGAVDIIRSKMIKHDDFIKTLIICPIVVLENWKREFLVHSNIPENKIQVIDGVTKLNGKKVKNPTLKIKLEQIRNSYAEIFILNTESVTYQPKYKTVNIGGVKKRVKQDYSNTLWHEVLNGNFKALIVDESHRFKSFNGTRSKGIHQLVDNGIRYRYILTGTPILQNALDIWSQFYILNKNIFGGNFYIFRERFFYDANAGMPAKIHFPNWKPKDKEYYDKYNIPFEDNDKILNTIIYKHANRVMKKDVLDLPPLTFQTLYVEMDKEQSRIYNDMKRDLVATLESDIDIMPTDFNDLLIKDTVESLPNTMVADLAIVKLIRLQQIILGVFTNVKGEVTILNTKRLEVLKNLLSELTINEENKIILWVTSSPLYQVLSNLCNELNIKHTFLTGLQSKVEKQKNIDDFNNNKDIKLIIANQGAGGTGVNLTAANYSIYYSRSFNLEHDLQSEARNYRGGQTRNVTRIDLVTKDTVDEKILKALSYKKAMADDILNTTKNEFSKDDILNLI